MVQICFLVVLVLFNPVQAPVLKKISLIVNDSAKQMQPLARKEGTC